NKLWEEVKELKEGQNKLWEEVKELKEGQNKLWEEVKELKATQNEILKEIAKLWQAVADLRKDVDELKETTKNMQKTLERLTLSVEDEGREVIGFRLEKELGEKINLDRIFVDNEEINIYGVSNELCVIGEATVRLGISLVDELERKIEKIREKRPDLMRKRIIKLLYVDIATPDSVELARKKGIWLLTVKGDITPRIIHEIS
ncbi:MAG: coiled-coil domain-containing protein, partial [Caldisphaera sp.]